MAESTAGGAGFGARGSAGLPVAQDELAEILQATPDFVAMASAEGDILFLNAGARNMVGLPAAADGLGFDIPAEAQRIGSYRRPEWARRKLLDEGLPTARARGVWHGETALYDAQGQERAVSHTVLAHYDAHGDVRRYSTIIRDIAHHKQREQALATYLAAFYSSRDAILLLDDAGAVTEANPAAAQLFGVGEPEHLAGRPLARLAPPDQADGTSSEAFLQERLARALAAGSAFFEWRQSGAAGRFPAAVQLSRVELHDRTGVMAVIRDITARQDRYEAIFNRTYQFTGLMSPDGTLLEANQTALAFGGVARAQVIGKHIWETPWFQNAADPEGELRDVVARAATGEFIRYEREVVGAQGPVTIDFSIRPVADRSGAIALLIPEGRDITELVEARRRMAELAYTDERTGLPNREAFRERAAARLAETPEGGYTAVLVVDLERFLELRQSFGHDFADRVLRAAAERLRRALGERPELAQVSEAEFAAILPGLSAPGEAARAAERIRAELCEPLVVPGSSIRRQARIGIALYPGHGSTGEELLRQGEVARDWGRFREGGGYWFADPDAGAAVRERLYLTDALQDALAAGRLQVHYQPLVDPRTGALVGLEALARWYEPGRGWISPGEFIPLAESTGLIERVSAAVRSQVLADLAGWRDAGRLPPRVSVNLAVPELRDPMLPTRLLGALRDRGLAPSLLELEVTESLLAETNPTPREVLAQLRRAGIAVAVDDFGTGYSALAQISRLPADRLKLDKAFIRDLPETPANQAIVAAVERLAAGFDLALLAEGVEVEAERAELVERGIGECQGFYFAKPQAPDRLAAWLAA